MLNEDEEPGCIHFPGDPNAVCTICNPKKEVIDPWEAVPVVARYPGQCVKCPAPIREGDMIVSVAGGWAHEDCRANG